MQLSCAFLLLLSAVCASGQSAEMVRVGGVAGENGIFGSLNGLVTMYSDGNLRAQYGKAPKWQLIQHTGPVSFDIRKATLAHTSDNVPLAAAHEFSFCDPFNQIDLSRTVSSRISLLLPKTAKVKAAEKIDEKTTLVIYAADDSPVHYRVRVALFSVEAGRRERLIGSDTVSIDGNYCGMQVLDGPYRAIFLDEPTGSSDFAAVYIYKIAVGESARTDAH